MLLIEGQTGKSGSGVRGGIKRRAKNVRKRRHEHSGLRRLRVDERNEHMRERALRVAERFGNQRKLPGIVRHHDRRIADALEIAPHAVQGAGHDSSEVVAQHVQQVLGGRRG